MQRTACNFSIPLKSVLAPFLPLRPCGRVEEPSEYVLNSDTNEEPRVSNPDSKKMVLRGFSEGTGKGYKINLVNELW